MATDWQQQIDSLPPTARAAIERVAAERKITAEQLAFELGSRYLEDRVYRRRIDRIINEILRVSKRRGDIKHLIPRNDSDALLINMILQIKSKQIWPGVGTVISKAIETA